MAYISCIVRDAMAVQNLIKDARERLGLSQVGLGRKLAVNALTVSRWERGANLPQRKHWPKIKDVLGIELAVVAEQSEAAE